MQVLGTKTGPFERAANIAKGRFLKAWNPGWGLRKDLQGPGPLSSVTSLLCVRCAGGKVTAHGKPLALESGSLALTPPLGHPLPTSAFTRVCLLSPSTLSAHIPV